MIIKHKIISDKYVYFERNIDALIRRINQIDHVIIKAKIIMKTVNNDYSAYKHHYVGYFWSERKIR